MSLNSIVWFSASIGNSKGVETFLANARRICNGENLDRNPIQLTEEEQAEVINLQDEEEEEEEACVWIEWGMLLFENWRYKNTKTVAHKETN